VPVGRSVDDLFAPLRAEPQHAGVLSDFDGTLAPIVDDPASAAPLDGVGDLLGSLAERYALVALLSGRPVAFLQPHVPRSVVLSGLYGLEVVEHGRRTDHPSAAAWREVVDDVVAVARVDGPEGMRVEPKGFSLTLHFRGRPDVEPAVRAWAEQQAARSGLVLRSARMSFELHPPIEADKGTALRDLIGGLHAVCFIGDDYGDLPAFDQLDVLQTSGVSTVRAAVRSNESPAELLERADIVVDGPAGAAGLLRALL
jgi:trehalose 6-phosphate phosphatase